MKKIYLIQTVLAFMLISFVSCSKDPQTEEQIIPEGVIPPDETGLKINNPYWSWANSFPGDVTNEEPRLQNVKVTVNGNYTRWSELLINVTPSSPYVSTGLYIPVAEMITVNVPEGVTGLKYRIGIYHCTIDDTAPRKRYTTITKGGYLKAGENKIFNYFGGHLYILFTKPMAQPIELTISGAVKSPDFILGKTDPQVWKSELAATSVPWGEISCKNMILTMPVSEMRKVQDPEALMEFYEEIVIEDYNKYCGMTENSDDLKHCSPSFPWRFCTDIQLCVGAGHNGYPFVGGLDWAGGALDLVTMQNGNWGVYHELGHNYQTNSWKWDVLGEVTCNLHVYHMMNRKYNKWPPRDVDFKAIVNNYINNPANTSWEFSELDVFYKLTPFIHIAQEYGWRFFSYLAKEGRINGRLSTDQERIDFFAEKLTEYSHLNMTDFFKAWHLPLSSATEAYMGQFDAPTKRFWEYFDMTNIPSEFTERTPLKK